MNAHIALNPHITNAHALSDDALLARVKSLAAQERGTIAELIAHLAEVETRGLHLAAGYGSMFTYCRGALRLSEHEAYHRIEAARAAQRFPVVLDQLAEGVVNLTTVKLLARHLTVDNHAQVLESARGLSRMQVEELVARLAPAPDVPATVRKLPAPTPPAPTQPASGGAPPAASPGSGALEMAVGSAAAPATGAVTAAPNAPARATVNALSPDRYKMQLTISGDTFEKLRLATDMLRHANPEGDQAQVLDRALTLLIADLAKKKFGATKQPRPSRGVAAVAKESRHISGPVKCAVFVRDLGRCAFVGKAGHRCNDRAFLEFHHVKPYAAGGPPTVENIQLRCRQHNVYEWHLRSTDVRVREDEWLCRQVAAGALPSTAACTRSGPSRAAGVPSRP